MVDHITYEDLNRVANNKKIIQARLNQNQFLYINNSDSGSKYSNNVSPLIDLNKISSLYVVAGIKIIEKWIKFNDTYYYQTITFDTSNFKNPFISTVSIAAAGGNINSYKFNYIVDDSKAGKILVTVGCNDNPKKIYVNLQAIGYGE